MSPMPPQQPIDPRNTPRWRVCRRLIHLLIELRPNMVERWDDSGTPEFYSSFSHDQHAMDFLRGVGVVEGCNVGWRLVEADLERGADMVLDSAHFDDVLSALVSTTIYNGLLPEQPKPFSLPLHEYTGGEVLEELRMLMSDLIELGYARYWDELPGGTETYIWTDWMCSSMLANYASGWKPVSFDTPVSGFYP